MQVQHFFLGFKKYFQIEIEKKKKEVLNLTIFVDTRFFSSEISHTVFIL